MNRFVKPIALMGMAGALAVAAMAPQAEARNGRWVAGAAGFAAGAAIGAAAANAASGGYYYDRGYYDPGYAYAPAYDSYAYEPAYTYGPDSYAYEPAYTYHRGVNRPNNSYTIKKRHLEGTE